MFSSVFINQIRTIMGSSVIDKTALIGKIKQLEGLTDEEKSNLIGLLRQHKKYGLVWEDKPEDVEERLREELPVLKEVKERALISDQPDAPNHILIEGDNLEALTALSYTHEGKIDVIYIDPPYNTGNKDFVYNDSYVDTEDSYRHSKWLSFMSKRLRIAKRLLSQKGVIFISIDNNEFAQLKMLCDEVFLEKNFVEVLKWKRKKQPSFLATHTASVMEYVIVYAKEKQSLDKLSIEGTSDATKKVINISNNECLRHFSAGVRVKLPGEGVIPAGVHTIKTMNVTYLQDVHYRDGKTLNEVDVLSRFSESQENIDRFIADDLLFITANTGLRRDVSKEEIGRRKSITDLLLSEWGDNQESEQEQLNIFGKRMFDYAKPLMLVYNLIKSFNSKKTIVLDFFAGSGTTLHATMQLNSMDDGHRQCILVTNNENGICKQVTYERNKRVIQGYTTPKDQAVEGLHNNNLRYYRTEFIPRERTQRNMRALVNAATDLLCIKEDLYEEKPLLGTLKLKPQLARYFSDGQKHMLVVYREEVVTELVEAIKTLELGKSMLKIYIFSPGRYAFDDNFYEVQDKVQLVALPAAIYDAYQRVLPKQKERLLVEAEEPAPQPTASAMTIDFEEGGEQ